MFLFKERCLVAVNVSHDASRLRLRRGISFIGCRIHFGLDFVAHNVNLVLRQEPMFKNVFLRKHDRITPAGALQFLFASVLGLIVRRRMRIQTHDLSFDQGGPPALAHALDDGRHCLIHRLIPGPVHMIAGQSEAISDSMDF